RAKATVEAVLKAAKLDVKIRFDETVYGASTAELMGLIRRLPDSSACALLVGHNPGFEDLVGRLSGSSERMPTAALACLELPVDSWENVSDGEGKIAWLIT